MGGALDLVCESELDGTEMAEANANGEENGGEFDQFRKRYTLFSYVLQHSSSSLRPCPH